MDLMNERERTGATGPPPAHLLRPAPLGRDDFAAAVRTALRGSAPRTTDCGRVPSSAHGWRWGPTDRPPPQLRG